MMQWIPIVLVLAFTFVSGIGDAQGFLHAAYVWKGGQIVWDEVWKSALGYAVGVVTYWFAVKFANELGIVSPEIQTLAWFVVTIVSVALFSGKFLHWQLLDQVIAVLVLGGIGWLLLRTGG